MARIMAIRWSKMGDCVAMRNLSGRGSLTRLILDLPRCRSCPAPTSSGVPSPGYSRPMQRRIVGDGLGWSTRRIAVSTTARPSSVAPRAFAPTSTPLHREPETCGTAPASRNPERGPALPTPCGPVGSTKPLLVIDPRADRTYHIAMRGDVDSFPWTKRPHRQGLSPGPIAQG